MNVFFSRRVKLFCGIIVGISIFALLLLNIFGYLFDCKYLSVFAAIAEVNKYEVRSQLLMDAMNEVGACSPEYAAKVWADGLKARSGALQYSVMSAELKAEYARLLEKNAPNWVTGMSSPWIEDYRIIWTESPDANTRIIEIKFSTATSTGPAGDYNALITIVRVGDFWRISKIYMDEGLYPYTGMQPE